NARVRRLRSGARGRQGRLRHGYVARADMPCTRKASTGWGKHSIGWGERSEPQRNPRAPRALNVRVHPPGAVAWRARALGFALLTPTYGAGSPFEIRSRRMRLANSEKASRPARPLARATQSG